MSTNSSSRLLQRINSETDLPEDIYTYENDANGNQTKDTYDEDRDGTSDYIHTFEYDSNGNRTKETYDNNADGTSDRINTYEFDGDSNLTRETYDVDADGNPNRVNEYEYNSGGNRTKEIYDNNGDGMPEHVVTYDYDGNGNQIKETYDRNGNGEPNRINTYKYDDSDNLVEQTIDRDGDGDPDDVHTYENDANGNQIKDTYDEDRDGTSDYIHTFEYDSNGNRTKETYDNNADGTSNRVNTYEFDGDSNLTRETYDADADGNPNRINEYDYDSNGNRTKETYDRDGDGKPNRINTYEYDGNNNLIKATFDRDADGTFDETDTYIYSPELTAGDRSGGLEVASIGLAQSLKLNFEDFGLKGISELLVFNLEEDGSKTQLADFFMLEAGKLASGYSTNTSIETSLLSPGAQLQFELVENGNARTGTVEIQADGTAMLDFGDSVRLMVALDDEATAPNLLREDATTIDLTGFSGGDVALNFSVYREASYDSTVGFYRTDSASGGIADLMTGEMLQPGDDGYKEAALSRQLDVQLSGENGKVSTFSSTMTGGDFLGMFLVSDGSDAATGELLFSSMGMNNGNDHVKALGDNTFGFEDMVGLGDRDFNDLVVKIEVA